MTDGSPAQEYLEALGRELRVRSRHRRRVIEELAAHIEEAAEREQRLGVGAEEAQRRAVERLGEARTVAAGFSIGFERSVAAARERVLRLIAYLGAGLVVACASFTPLSTRDADGHFGIEVAAAAAAAVVVLLVDLWESAANRMWAALAAMVGVWIAATVLLVRDGEALFCAQVLAGVLGAASLLHAARKIGARG